MATSKQKTDSSIEKNFDQEDQEVDVLYQKLAGKWFAFSVIGDDVFMSSIAEDSIMNSPCESHAGPKA